jgi:methionyl-tRNA formyltransferase
VRVLLLANNRLGADVAAVVREAGDEFVGVVLHPTDRRRYGAEILQASGVDEGRVLDAARLNEPETLRRIDELRPEIGVSVLFGYILRRDVLDRLGRGCVNLHPGYLPYNRGAFPNVWSIVERTPAGTTLHWVDEGVDTGDIAAQERVSIEAHDTGETLYYKLEAASLDLFRRAWPQVRTGAAPRSPQSGKGTVHKVRDVAAIDEIDPDRMYRAGDLIDILRARTFPPYASAYFRDRGKKIYVAVRLTPADSD